ncbi:hypothetical protein ACPW96_11935 [Micromonospora sp. DT81.3]|uniref:hypothetical protein n=1 Tax=Micromonospora sp. DT81.3 TaxID=3416523 RepID=UPI003CEE73F6
MTMQLTAAAAAMGTDQSVPRLSAGARERLQPAGHDLWRVLDPSGHVIGHVQSFSHPLGVRFRAKRYHSPSTRFRDLGEFWSADDAVASLRYSS